MGGLFHKYFIITMFSLIILLLLKLSSRRTQLQHLIWMRLCVMVQMKKRMTVTLHMLNLLTKKLTILWTILCNMPLFSRGQSHEGANSSDTNKSEANSAGGQPHHGPTQAGAQPIMGQLSRSQVNTDKNHEHASQHGPTQQGPKEKPCKIKNNFVEILKLNSDTDSDTDLYFFADSESD